MADRRLQVFHTVARLLSFTRAAESLHMTQPAVTFQVRQLEEQYNLRLFDRAHNRITLTPAGELIYGYAERIFGLYRQMESEIRQFSGEVSGLLLLGASTTVADYMLPALLGDFKRRFPEVAIRLAVSNTEGIVAMVAENRIDLGVVEGPVANRNLEVEVCRVDQLVAVVAPEHELARGAPLPAEQLTRYPYIGREEGSGTREVIAEYLNASGLEHDALDVVLELGSPEAIKGAVAAGMGISVLSRATLDKELALGSLVAVPLAPPLERTFSFVRQKQVFRSPAAQRLLEFVRKHCDASEKR